jgi:hypothetical protein
MGDVTKSKPPWESFQDDMSSLGDRLHDAYRTAPTDSARAELRASLDSLQEAADAVFRSLDHIAQDPEVRAGTRRAARSFGNALAETFREIGDEVVGAVRGRKGGR